MDLHTALRFGAFEYVGVVEKEKLRFYVGYERDVTELLAMFIRFYQENGVQPPAYVFVSVLGLKGFRLQTGNGVGLNKRIPLDRNDLILSEVVVDDFSAKPQVVMKPIFDLVWNAFGYERSYNYDKDGNWVGPR